MMVLLDMFFAIWKENHILDKSDLRVSLVILAPNLITAIPKTNEFCHETPK